MKIWDGAEKAKEMRPLGRRGMLQVKQTLEHLQLSSFNGQSNTPAFCLVEWIKNMISKDSKSSILFPYFRWSHVHCKDWCMHCYRIINTQSVILDQVSNSPTDHEESQRIFPQQSWVTSNFVPLMFLQGHYFSTEGALGLPKAKPWWQHWTSTLW